MNKKGFTLVELLAVITVLILLFSIAIPNLMENFSDKRNKLHDATINEIERVAGMYLTDNSILYSDISENGYINISVKTLCENEYLDCPLKDPIDNSDIDGYVKVTYQNNKYNYSYVNNNSINENVKLEVYLNGGNLNNNISGIYKEGDVINLENPTKNNGIFNSWKVIKGNSIINENKLIIGSTDTIIYAVWKVNTNLIVDLDGGTGNNSNGTYESGTIIDLGVPKKEKNYFNGWEVVNGNGIISGNKVIIGTENTTIKAIWDNTAVGYIKELLAQESTSNNGLFIDDTKDKNIRYRGSNPNNYVYFNCKDKDSSGISYGTNNYNYSSSCEVWRIIGVFDVDDGSGKVEKRVKLVRDVFTDSSGNVIKMSFDSSANNGGTDNNTGYGINQWGESTYEDGSTYEGADLMRMLNGYYIGKDSTCTYCNGENQGTCSNDCTSSITPLSAISLNMIEDAWWNIGGLTVAASEPFILSLMYTSERGTQLGKTCTASSVNSEGKYTCTDTVNRTTNWVGKIGLIYGSDYGYASENETCKNDVYGVDSLCNQNNWFVNVKNNFWTINRYANSSMPLTDGAFVGENDNFRGSPVFHWRGVRPSLYLKSSIKIVSGSGTETSPYKLSI